MSPNFSAPRLTNYCRLWSHNCQPFVILANSAHCFFIFLSLQKSHLLHCAAQILFYQQYKFIVKKYCIYVSNFWLSQVILQTTEFTALSQNKHGFILFWVFFLNICLLLSVFSAISVYSVIYKCERWGGKLQLSQTVHTPNPDSHFFSCHTGCVSPSQNSQTALDIFIAPASKLSKRFAKTPHVFLLGTDKVCKVT